MRGWLDKIDFSKITIFESLLFRYIYWWAGQCRKVNISKNNKPFIPIQSFHTAENYINSLIYNYHKNTDTKEKITNDLANILDNLNYFHPFREGNGRTQREVIRVLAMMKNYEAIINIGADDNIYIWKGVTQKSWFWRNRFCRVTLAQFIRYLKSFYKANLDINKSLRLWVFLWTFKNFRTFG